MTQLLLGDIKVEVIKKKIKNLHLRVTPPAGQVQISAPIKLYFDIVDWP